MQKKIVVLLASLFVLGSGGYTAFWYMSASRLEEQVEQNLKRVSESGLASLTYTKVKVSGFPFRYDIEVHQPNLTVDLTPFLATGDTDIPSKSEVKLTGDDKAVFSTNLWGTQYAFGTVGDVHTYVSFAGKQGHLIARAQDGSWYRLTTRKKDWIIKVPENLEDFLALVKENMQAFKSFETEGTKLECVDADTNKILAASDKANFKVSFDPLKEENYKIQCSYGIENTIYTEDLARFMEKFFGSDTELGKSVLEAGQQLSSRGNINTKAELSYTGPIDPILLIKSNVLGFINFKSQDALSTSSFHGDFKSQLGEGEKPEISIILESNSKATEKWHKEAVRWMKTGMYGQQISMLLDLTPSLSAAEKKTVHETIVSIIPKFHEMGEVFYKVDLKVLPESLDINSPAGRLQINGIAFKAADYGFDLTGSMGWENENPAGTNEAVLRFANFDGLYADLCGFTQRVMEAMAKIDPKTGVNPSIVQEIKEPLRGFLKQMAEPHPESTSDLMFKVKFSEGNLTFGDKTLDETLQLFLTHMGPVLMNNESLQKLLVPGSEKSSAN